MTVLSKQPSFFNFWREKAPHTRPLQAMGTLRSRRELQTLAHEYEEQSRSCTLRVELESVLLEEFWKALALIFDVPKKTHTPNKSNGSCGSLSPVSPIPICEIEGPLKGQQLIMGPENPLVAFMPDSHRKLPNGWKSQIGNGAFTRKRTAHTDCSLTSPRITL